MTGKIISYLEDKKYGFIKGDNDKKYFFHFNDLKNKSIEIYDGMEVEFEEKATEKGYSALKVSELKNNNNKNNYSKETKYTVPIQPPPTEVGGMF